MTSRYAATMCCLLLCATLSVAQTRLPGQWSLSLEGGWVTPLGDLQGTLADFQQQFLVDYNSKSYPFSDPSASTHGGGGQLAYRFPFSPISVYGGAHLHVFTAQDKDDLTSANNAMALAMITLSLGGEYQIGPNDFPIQGFARFGFNTSAITGYIIYKSANMAGITLAWREGIEVEGGARYNFPVVPLSLETGLAFIDANLFGKSYTPPQTFTSTLTTVVRQRDLNDDANPGDASDHTRTISFLYFHLGLRLWF